MRVNSVAKPKSAAAPASAPLPVPPEIIRIERASLARPTELFGTNTSDFSAILRRLQKAIHPDLFDSDVVLRERADAAFRKLQQIYTAAIGKTAPSPAARMGDWVIEAGLSRGDVADLYMASPATDKVSGAAVLKLARIARDNDLIKAEAEALTLLHSPLTGKGATDALKARAYLPAFYGSVTASGRAGNILSYEDGYIPLSRFNDIWVGGILPQHLVWIVNRALTVISYAHHRGLIHGAIVPEHLLLNTTTHGIKLVDWCYSVTMESGKAIAAVSVPRKGMYAPEVLRKIRPTAAADLYMLLKSVATVRLDGVWPKALDDIRTWVTADSPNSRPQTAIDLAERWMEAADKTFGPRKFIELKLPN